MNNVSQKYVGSYVLDRNKSLPMDKNICDSLSIEFLATGEFLLSQTCAFLPDSIGKWHIVHWGEMGKSWLEFENGELINFSIDRRGNIYIKNPHKRVGYPDVEHLYFIANGK